MQEKTLGTYTYEQTTKGGKFRYRRGSDTQYLPSDTFNGSERPDEVRVKVEWEEK